MRIGAIEVVSVPVADQDRAKEFYEQRLGFEVLVDAPFGDGQRWVQLAPAGAQTSISLVTWFDDFAPGSLRGLVLAVDDMAEAQRELGGRGIEFPEGPMETPWGKFLSFADPDGNRWSLREPAEGEG